MSRTIMFHDESTITVVKGRGNQSSGTIFRNDLQESMKAVNHGRHIACTKAVVYVYHAHV